MPFSAEVQNGDGHWRRVDITTIEQPKVELAGHRIRCADPDCGAEYVVKHGPLIAAHFAHKAGASGATCAFAGGGESQEHLDAKRAILERLRSSRYYKGATIEPERILRAGDIKRIVDVMVAFPDGSFEVHEAQLSRTSVEECRQRTEDYKALGAETVMWWFGGSNRGDVSLQQWATKTCGIVGTLEFSMQPVSI